MASHVYKIATRDDGDCLLCPSCGSYRIGKWGTTSTGRNRFRCRQCKKVWTVNPHFLGSRLPPDVVNSVITLLGSGKSIRQVAKETGVSKGTVEKFHLHRSTLYCPPIYRETRTKHKFELATPVIVSEDDGAKLLAEARAVVVLSGFIDRQDMKNNVRYYVREHKKQFKGSFATLSLSQPVADGLTIENMVEALQSAWNGERRGLTWRDSTGKIVYAERADLEDETPDCGGPYPARWCACDRCGSVRRHNRRDLSTGRVMNAHYQVYTSRNPKMPRDLVIVR